MRTIPTTLAMVIGVVALAGCGGGSRAVEEADPDDPGLAAGGGSASCVALLEWQDATYWGGQTGEVELGESLGEATEPGCADTGGAESPEREVEVFAIEGVDPAIAFAARPDFVFLAAGYVLESPTHPLHELVYGREGPPAPPEKRCGNPATAEATAVESAAYGLIFRVTNVAGGDAVFRQTGEREVVFDAETAFRGLERNGVPYVAAGERFELRARPCKQNGTITLVADRLTAE